MEVQHRKPNKKPTKIEEMSKEQIRQAIVKKRDCNAKAQTIVESLLEKGISENYFTQCLPDINQSHFEDIVEERAIVHLCGYPLCSKTISERDIPKQKYRISVKTNKVYDITARKSFCSNSCYKSAMFVQKQMLTSPLWFREYEEIPQFDLLPLDAPGTLGQEVDVALVQRVSIKPKTDFTSVNDFASASLLEITGDEGQNDQETNIDTESAESNEITKLESKEIITVINKLSNVNIAENPTTQSQEPQIGENLNNKLIDCNEINKMPENIDKTESFDNNSYSVPKKTESSIQKQTTKLDQKKPHNPLNIVGDIVERPERKIDPILTQPDISIKPTNSAKKLPQKKQPSITLITIEVEKCLAEWFTLDTLLFLFGEERVKEMVTDKGECIKEYLNNYAKSIFYNSNTYDQYQTLCKKLNMLELEDRRSDSLALQRETKPLPDYSILQGESERMQIKVKAFLSGETEIREANMSKEKEGTEDGSNVTQLPLVDSNAQNALRRRIVCQHLNKVLPDVLRSLGLMTLSISSNVRLIVNTFKLKADNIMFKPIQWTLIAIVIIKLLSLRDKRLEYLLESPMAFKHMQLLLLSYKQGDGYLERLTSWLTDIDRLLDTSDVQMTVE